mmetsp:Transcript_5992/g.23267  ORF Transcript_5992/g.23267 Transcript_5992/m.23267 type:complete len:208 (+) Transcript_5992:506-1129(+)
MLLKISCLPACTVRRACWMPSSMPQRLDAKRARKLMPQSPTMRSGEAKLKATPSPLRIRIQSRSHVVLNRLRRSLVGLRQEAPLQHVEAVLCVPNILLRDLQTSADAQDVREPHPLRILRVGRPAIRAGPSVDPSRLLQRHCHGRAVLAALAEGDATATELIAGHFGVDEHRGVLQRHVLVLNSGTQRGYRRCRAGLVTLDAMPQYL